MPIIDDKVVQMTFDNKQFERGVAESVKSLTGLKEALKFDNVEESLQNIEKAFNGLDLSGLEKSVDFIASRFKPLGKIADKALGEISSKAIEYGKKIGDAFFGFSDVSAGKSKYETYTRSVQTITNATGKSVAEVEKVLESLQEYTDETSYDFAEMVSSIGKFTSAGIDLTVAEESMEGIANWAAKSGAGIQEANRAFYNLSQAISTGSVKLIDWKSIENANMATKEFKELAIQTAIELGVLQDRGNGVGSIVTTNEEKLNKAERALEKAKNATKDRNLKIAAAQEQVAAATKETTIDFKNFNETLSEGWLTSDVLLKVLEKYANDQTAYEAAQKALNFGEAIQAVKDALSSGWMKSYKYIFGDLDEAKKLWTDVANALYEYVSIFADWRNDVLKSWHDMGGYNDMIEAASNLWQTFMNIVRGVGEALSTVFPILKAENMTQFLRDGTKKLKDWSASLLDMFGLYQEIEEEEDKTADKAEDIKESVDDVQNSVDKTTESMDDLGDASEEVAKSVSDIETGIKRGMRGDNVKALQQKLVSLGFRLDKFGVDGIFGPETQAAVEELQRALGVEVTGALDEATFAALNTEEGMAKLQERMHKGLSSGDVGKDVRDIQNELNKYLGENDKLTADGIYGPQTKAAVEKLQKELGIEVTGVWDETTRAAFESSKMIRFSLDNIHRSLKKGMVGDAVKSLQEQLIKTGYLTDQSVADGVYGPKTEEAIKKLQHDLGVEETGVWDAVTAQALKRAQKLEKANSESAKSIEEASETIEEASDKNKDAAESSEKTVAHTSTTMMRLQNIVKGWGAALKIVGKFIGAVAKINANIMSTFTPLVDVIDRFGSVYGIMVQNLSDDLDKDNVYDKFVNTITNAFGPFGDLIKKVADGMNTFLDAYDDFLESTGKRNTFGSYFEFLKEYLNKIPVIGLIADVFETVKSVVGPIITFLIEEIQKLIGLFGSDGFKQIKETVLSWISDKIVNLGEAIKDFKKDHPEITIENFLNKLREIGGWIGGKVGVGFDFIKSKLIELKVIIDKFIEAHPEFSISNILTKIKDVFVNAGDMLSKFFASGQQSESGTFFDEIKARFKAFEPALKWMEGIKDRIINLLHSLFGGEDHKVSNTKAIDVVKAQATVFDSLKEKLSGIQDVVNWFVSLKDTLINAWSELSSVNDKDGPDLAKEGGFTSVFDKLGAFSKEAGKIDFGKIISTSLKAIAAYSLLNISKGFKRFGTGAETFGKDIGEAISNTVSNLIKPFSKIADNIADNFDFKDFSKALIERIKYGKQDKDTIGTTMLKMAGSLLMAAAAVALLLSIDFDKDKAVQVFVGFGVIVGLMVGAVIAVQKIGGEGAGDWGKQLLMLGGAILLVALAIGAMNKITEAATESNLWAAVKIIGGMVVVLGLISALVAAVSKNDSSGLKGIIGFCAGIFILVLAFEKMISVVSNAKEETLWTAVKIFGGMVIVLGIIATLVAAVSRGGSSGIKGVIGFCAGVYVLVLALEKMISVVSNTKEETLWTAVKILGGMVVALGIIAVLVAAFSKNDSSGVKGLAGLCSGIYVLVLALEKMISVVSNTKEETLWTAVKILGGMVVALGIIAVLVAAFSRNKKSNIGGFKDLVLGLASMVAVLSFLINIVDKADPKSLDKALWILGGMVVAVIAFVAASAFFGGTGGSKRTKSLLKGAAAITGALGIIILAATILVGGLGELARIEQLDLIGSMKRGKEIFAIVVETFTMFRDKLGINLLAVAGFLAASWLIGYFKGGTSGVIKGASAIAAAFAIIVSAATILIGAFGELARIEQLDLINSMKRGKKILSIVAETCGDFVSKSGINLLDVIAFLGASWLIGYFPGGSFAVIKGASAIAAAFTIVISAATIVSGAFGELARIEQLDLINSMKRGKEILSIVAEMFNDFVSNSGINLLDVIAFLGASWLIGYFPGGSFAVIKGASAIAAAFTIVTAAITAVITGIGAIDKNVETDLVEATKTGGEILSSIADVLVSLRDKLGITLPGIAGALVASEIIGLIPGGKWALIGGASAIAFAADALITIVGLLITGLGGLNEWTKGGLEKAINAGGAVLESISAAIARVKSGFTKVYNEDLKDFGEAMNSVKAGIEGVSEDGSLEEDMKAAKEMASELYRFFTSLQTYSLDNASGTVTGYTSVASLLLDDVNSFGQAISSLWNGVSGISKDKDVDNDIDVSMSVVTKLKTDFLDKIGNDQNMPDGSGLTAYNNKISGILDHVKTFGENVGIFDKNVSGFSASQIESDTSTAISVATKIAEFLEAMTGMNIEQKAKGIRAWFAEATNGETVIDSVGELAEAMTKSKDSFSGLANMGIEKDVEVAIASLKAVAEFLTYVSTDANLDSVEGDNEGASSWIVTDKLQKVLSGLGRIAKELVSFNSQTKDLPLDDVADISRMISDFLQVGLVGADFDVNNVLSGVTFDSINGRISEIAGYIQTAIAQNKSALTSSGASLSDGLLSAVKEKTSEFTTAGENFIKGLTNGVYFQTRFAVEAAAYVARQMVRAVKDTFQTASPSKVTTQIGRYFSEGLGIGVEEEGDSAIASSKNVADNMMKATKDSLMPLSSFLLDEIDDAPVIRPVVDLSNVDIANKSIQSYFGGQGHKMYISTKLAGDVAGEFERQRSQGRNGFKNVGNSSTVSKDPNNPEKYILNDSDNAHLIDSFNMKFDKLANAMSNMQIVLDTGEFVGATSGAYDKQFGKMTGRRERGN